MTGQAHDDEANDVWQALQQWLQQDSDGRILLTQFQHDPDGQEGALANWIEVHSSQLPQAVVTYVSGGNIGKIINIAKAESVRFTLPPSPRLSLHQLPPDISDFTGRHAYLNKMISLLASTVRSGTAIVISAIAGMPGVGKSTLAVHAAHILSQEHFPDAQLYADLRGSGGEPDI